MYLLNIYFLTFIVCILSTKLNVTEETMLIKNYLKIQTTPSLIFLYTCWDKQKLNLIIRELEAAFPLSVIQNFLKICYIKNNLHTLIISDSSCKNFDLLIEQAENLELLKAPNRWLILNTTKSGFIPINISLLIDSNFVIVSELSENNFHFELVYKYTSNDRNFVKNDLGLINENHFLYYNNFTLGKNRTNLRGSNLTVSYVKTNPEVPFDITDYRYSHIDSVSKLSYAMIDIMLEVLNCTKMFIQRDSWGYKVSNSIYYDGGMFGDLQNGTAEIGGTASFYTFDRLDMVDYIAVTTPSNMRFILKAPPLSYLYNIFTLPFRTRVWYSLYAITAISIMALYIILNFENRLNLENANAIANIKTNIFDVIMVQIGAVTQQGSDTESKSNSGRIATFIIFLILMFLYSAYSGNIVALLQSSSNKIKDVRDLLDSSISLGVEDIVYNKYWFPNQDAPVRRAIYEMKIAPKDKKPNYMSVEEGIKRIRTEWFAFHVETTSGYKVILETFREHEKCGLVEIDYLNTLTPSITMRKKSPYKEIVKIGFRKICESGIRNRQINRIYFEKPKCGHKGSSFASVEIIDVYFAFEIFGLGLLFAVILLIVEILYQKFISRKKKNLIFCNGFPGRYLPSVRVLSDEVLKSL